MFEVQALIINILYYCFAVTAATNKQRTAAKDTAKLDRETEELHRMPERYAYAVL